MFRSDQRTTDLWMWINTNLDSSGLASLSPHVAPCYLHNQIISDYEHILEFKFRFEVKFKSKVLVLIQHSSVSVSILQLSLIFVTLSINCEDSVL